jgi:hypothetical protein
MRRLLALLILALFTAPAAAQGPWYARGEFNGWTTDNPMTDQGGGLWTADITGLFNGEPYNFKLANADWSTAQPASDSRIYSNAAGELHFRLYDQTSWSDGWFPNDRRRVGYEDHQQFDWEIVGSFNGFSGTHDPAYALTDMGNGLHRGTFPFNFGIYDFKFRGVNAEVGDPWDVSIGNDFGNTAGNNSFAVTSNGQNWTFELDLPNGRWRAFTDAVTTLDGDYNANQTVDAADYVLWRDNPAGHGGAGGYTTWRANFGNTSGASATWLLRGPQIADTQLTSQGGGVYTANLTGLTPSTDYDLRVFRSDLSATAPGGNAKVRANAAGEINVKFYELTGASWSDGWNPPAEHRFGYQDSGEFDWEIVGGFNSWPGANDPAYALTDQGNGLHTGMFTFNTPGTYPWKFRQIAATNPWNMSIGDDFSNSAADNTFTVTNPGEVWKFELDLPNGRWRAYMPAGLGAGEGVPEPASLALLMLGVAVSFGGLRRR